MNDGFASAYIFPTGTGTDQRGSVMQATYAKFIAGKSQYGSANGFKPELAEVET